MKKCSLHSYFLQSQQKFHETRKMPTFNHSGRKYIRGPTKLHLQTDNTFISLVNIVLMMRSIQQNTRNLVLTYGPNEMRSVQKDNSLIISVWSKLLPNKRLYCTMNSSKIFQKSYLTSFKAYFVRIEQINIKTEISQIFGKFSVSSR